MLFRPSTAVTPRLRGTCGSRSLAKKVSRRAMVIVEGDVQGGGDHAGAARRVTASVRALVAGLEPVQRGPGHDMLHLGRCGTELALN